MSKRRTNRAAGKGRGKTVTLCSCGTPTRDRAFVCDRCIDSMAADLRELIPTEADPGLWLGIRSVMAGERGIDYRTLGGAKGGSEATGIVLDDVAVRRAKQLRKVLSRLVFECLVHQIAHRGPDSNPPRSNSVPELARWLLWRLDAMALHPAFTQSPRDLAKAVDAVRWSVMPLSNRQWLGPCGLTPDCTGSMFARRDETFATCNKCDAWIEANIRRDWLIGELENRLCTAMQIAELYDPERETQRKVYKRIKQWASRGRLIDPRVFEWNPCPWPAPRDLKFRFGDAFDLLIQHEDQQDDTPQGETQ